MRTVESSSCYREHPDRALAKLVEHYPADCWLLYLSSRPMQQWFQEKGLASVIMGSAYEGIDLPFVDIDHRALCRHAVNTLVQAGHRHFVQLTRAKSRGGDLLGEMGFKEAVVEAKRVYPEIKAYAVYHQGTVADVVVQLQRLFRQQPPTAIQISQSAYYLTVICELAHKRLRVPEDVSLITGTDKPFFTYLNPIPASYGVNQPKFIQKLLGVTLAALQGNHTAPNANWLLPTYCPGGSLRRLPPPPT
jgi:DNA-binding LacI/PurR family transcriptional regulator